MREKGGGGQDAGKAFRKRMNPLFLFLRGGKEKKEGNALETGGRKTQVRHSESENREEEKKKKRETRKKILHLLLLHLTLAHVI